jgi:hypothetical protein
MAVSWCVFTTVHFDLSFIFVGRVKNRKGYSWVGSSLSRKNENRVDVSCKDKKGSVQKSFCGSKLVCCHFHSLKF